MCPREWIKLTEAWEQDYHRVSFVVPDTGGVYALTRRKPPKTQLEIATDATAAA